ncbi:MAG: deoxyribonuclease IV [Planctomycetota bacterium]|nr:deoxyribonuclease IV [Planctomycetota bacterium]
MGSPMTGKRKLRRSFSDDQERLCLGSHLSVSGGSWKAVREAQELDLQSLQIFTKNASRWIQRPIEQKEVHRFREEMEKWGPHPVTSHDSYLINLASPKEELFQKSIDGFSDEIERAELLGLDFLVMHPGAHVGSGVDVAIERIAAGMTECFRRVPHVKTRILLENTAGGGSTMGRSFEELRDLLDAIDTPERTGTCLDTCHMFAAGYELRTESGYQQTMKNLDRTVGARRVFALHLNDSKGDLGSHLDRHMHIGDGLIGRKGFEYIINDDRFGGIPKMLETPKENDMDRKNLALLKRLGKKKVASK